MFSEFLIFSFLKILFIPAYRSTDFEVHRNWLAITNSLNSSQWYYEDTSEWTLDYPPAFAYFEYALSIFAKYFDPEMLKIENLNYASNNTVLFQRFSVIFTDSVYFMGVGQCLQHVKDHQKFSILLLGNVGLIFVDHIHFQYNGMLFGILLMSCAKIMQKKYLQAAVFYTLLLNMKHIFIYIAPVYIFYMLRHYCSGNFKTFILNLLKLGSIVLSITAICLGPFINHLPQLLTRLFPFKRGLTHAYWAPNFWAIYNFLDKIMCIVLKVPQSSSTTGGLVQQHAHNFLPEITPQLTFIITILSMLPCCIKILMHKEESSRSFMKPLIIFAASSFMFGWHVHEKAILMILIPLQILSAVSPSEMTSSFLLSVFGIYSLTPLLYSKELIFIKLSMYLGYILFNYYSLITSQQKSSNFKWYENFYIFGIFVLPTYEFCLQHILRLNLKLPFLSLMLTSVYCAVGMSYFWTKCYLEYLFENKSLKKKMK